MGIAGGGIAGGGVEGEGLPLLVHGEVTSPEIDLFDREAVFIDTQLRHVTPVRRIIVRVRLEEVGHQLVDGHFAFQVAKTAGSI